MNRLLLRECESSGCEITEIPEDPFTLSLDVLARSKFSEGSIKYFIQELTQLSGLDCINNNFAL